MLKLFADLNQTGVKQNIGQSSPTSSSCQMINFEISWNIQNLTSGYYANEKSLIGDELLGTLSQLIVYEVHG